MTDKHDGTAIHIASPGDLRLLVDARPRQKRTRDSCAAKVATNTIHLHVSSEAMRMASPVWKTMLDPQGHFMESQSSASGKEVRLAEDDLDALTLILRIAHLQFTKVPDHLSRGELLNVAVLCDKYDTVGLVRPWLNQWWEQTLKPQASKSGHEDFLFMSWTSGDTETYAQIAKKLVRSTAGGDDGQLLSDSGQMITSSMPPGAIATILEARDTTISAILKTLGRLLDQHLSNEIICTASNYYGDLRTKCDALVLGSFIKGLIKIGLYPIPAATISTQLSVNILLEQLRDLDCHALPNNHGACGFTTELTEELDEIETIVMPSGVADSHRKHMEEQANKLRGSD